MPSTPLATSGVWCREGRSYGEGLGHARPCPNPPEIRVLRHGCISHPPLSPPKSAPPTADSGQTEVVFPSGSDPADPGSAITTNVGDGGSFTEVVRSGGYMARGLGEVFVDPADTKHQSRAFGLVLAAEEMALRQCGVATFLLNPHLTGAGSADGDIVLNPTNRAVSIEVTRLGAATTRGMTVTLTDGTVPLSVSSS
jgi:hypothetical protein